jgi:hypothetical protein
MIAACAASWKGAQTKPTTACGTYGSSREVISSAKSFTFTDARASSRCQNAGILRGTEGSNPVSSSKESANFRFLSGGRVECFSHRPSVPPTLNQHVEDLALVIDGTPQYTRSPAIRHHQLDAGARGIVVPMVTTRIVDRQEPCRACWARYLCGGGCHAEVAEVGRAGCDYIRGWLDYSLRAGWGAIRPRGQSRGMPDMWPHSLSQLQPADSGRHASI